MSIPSQLPQLVTAARAGALQALALQAGQVVEGKVLGVAPNGGTQVQINGQLLNLVLPVAIPAGTTIRFEVQGSGAQARLAMQPPQPPQATAAPTHGGPAPIGASAPAPVTVATAPMPLPPGVTPPPQTISVPVSTSAGLVRAAPAPAGAHAASVLTAPPAVPTAAPPTTPGPQPPATQGRAEATPQPAGSRPPALPYVAMAPAARAPSPSSSQAAPATGVTTGAAGLPGANTGGPAARVATQQAAVSQLVQDALPRQGSVAALTAAVTAVLGKVPLPEPVVRSALQVLSGQLDLGAPKLAGKSLQQAVLRSGVFQEATLARGTPTLTTDGKSSLLALRQALTSWLGGQAATVQAVANVPPPLRGSVPRVRSGGEPTISMDTSSAPEEIGKQLLERTEAALSRLRLHQHASLPDPVARQSADWSMDLPVLVGAHQTVMQLQIHRDAPDDDPEAAERGWQMRFALNLPGLGEIGAQVSLRGATTGVMLWATEVETASALEADLAHLREGLGGAGLNPGAVIVRHGAPPSPPRTPISQHLLDEVR